eukprot:TRINITY_DN4896_c0_g1_i3.p1 TRINITY_DN4896_c0_g1~~TRINITY_DN4896_c0_g1_i3.p1  ORF type:complete len:419 (-),score=75.97 TRINITY_DN4896_c0_g1_i3:465-1721(-)
MGRLSHCLALHLLLLSAASFELDNQLRSLYAREGALVLDERLLLRRDRALAPRQEKKEADNLGEPAGPVEWINAEREREASVAPTGAGDADRENRWYLHEVRRWQRRLAKMAGKLKSAGARRSERARRQEVLGAEEGLGRAEKDDLEGRVKAAGRERNRVERDWEKMEQTAARKVRDLKAIEGAVRHQIGREHEATEQMDRLARKAAKEAERFARESRARPGRAANYAFMRERESTNLKAVAGTMLSRQQSAITRDKMALSTLQAAQGLLLPESTAPTLGEPDEGADSSATTEQLRAQLAKLKRRVSRMAREMVRVRRAGRDQVKQCHGQAMMESASAMVEASSAMAAASQDHGSSQAASKCRDPGGRLRCGSIRSERGSWQRGSKRTTRNAKHGLRLNMCKPRWSGSRGCWMTRSGV